MLDRSNDHVYRAATDVVRAVSDMSRCLQQASSDQYVDLVKVQAAFFFVFFSICISGQKAM